MIIAQVSLKWNFDNELFVYKIVYVLLFDILFSIHVPSELLDIALTERIINMFFIYSNNISLFIIIIYIILIYVILIIIFINY